MNRTRRHLPGSVLVLGSVTSMQAGAALAKTLFVHTDPSGVVTLRLGLGGLLLLALWRKHLHLDTSTVRLSLALGVSLAAVNLLIFQAIARIPLGIAVTIAFLGPLTVAIVKSRRRLDIVWAGLAGIGVVLLIDSGSGTVDMLGVILALLSAAGWAAYILLTAAVGARTQRGEGLTFAILVAALLVAPFGVAQSGTTLLSPVVLAGGFGVAILSTLAANSLEMEALRRVPASVFGVMMSLEPAVAAMAGLLLLGEQLDPLQWLAVCSVVVGSAGATRTSQPPRVA